MLINIFNMVSFLGWLIIIYTNNLKLLQIIQSLAILEVIFAYFNIIKSNYIVCLLQIISRYLIVWGPLPYCNSELNIIRCWGLSDSVRYLYYLFPFNKIIKFLRYNLFWFLYPIGIALEICCFYYSPFKHFIIPIIIIYIIFGLYLYFHMIIQNLKKN